MTKLKDAAKQKDLELYYKNLTTKRDYALEHLICAWCDSKIKATDFHDQLSMEDYSITGLCMDCQTKTYGTKKQKRELRKKRKEVKMKTTPETIADITEEEMIYNLHQVQHILNGLIDGKTFNGKELDQDKLVLYKLSVIKIIADRKSA